MRLEVDIEELNLHGFDPRDRVRIGKSLEAELVRLLSEGGLAPGLASGGDVPSVPAGSIRLTGGGPSQAGRQIARSVYGGIGR